MHAPSSADADQRLLKPATPRMNPFCDWPLDRHNTDWTPAENKLLSRLWHEPDQSKADIARRLRRTVPSIAMQAVRLSLGQRAQVPESDALKRRAKPQPHMRRNGQPYTKNEDLLLATLWCNRSWSIQEIARKLERSIPAVSIRAGVLNLGHRPKKPQRSQEEKAMMRRASRARRRRAQRQAAEQMQSDAPAAPGAAKSVEDDHVQLLEKVDGVVLTRRINAAWSRVEAGEDWRHVIATARLTAVEAAALRRWIAD